MIDKKKHPLSLSKDIETILKNFRYYLSEYSSIIEKKENDDLFYLFDKENPSFYFRIYRPNQASDFSSRFFLDYLPHNEKTFDEYSNNLPLTQVKSSFLNWIKLLEQFNSIDYENDNFVKIYEEEYYAEFEILDEDVDEVPFNHERQLIMYNLLSLIENRLEKENSSNKKILEVLNETKELKNNIQNLTKKDVIKRLAKILAKTKKISLKLIIDIFDVAKKEIIKKGLQEGIDLLPKIIDLI
ncbi:MAG TPA: hypothetical protein VJ780_10790 [Flavobacterium sp.]|nr:hypothetical protein [Flavobacterium sp.]